MVVCTEQGYRQSQLESISRETPTRKKQYLDLLNDTIKELLREGRNNKLQTFGYSMEESVGQGGDAGSANDTLKVTFINLNK